MKISDANQPRLHYLRAFVFAQLLMSGGAMARNQSGSSPIPPASQQLLAMRTTDWNAPSGTLQRYQRTSASEQWQPIGSPILVAIGRSGLAWGIGLQRPPAQAADPVKIEGDGKSPAGAFALDTAFGYAPEAAIAPLHLPYLQVQDADKCVDDADSSHYNTLVSTHRTAKDWNSAEDMRRKDDLYTLGVVVEHNWDAAKQPGKGSCIFLHVWAGPNKGTDGCTAMNAADMRELLQWLDSQRHPVLVQLPQTQYLRLRDSWGLPSGSSPSNE